MHSIEWQSNEWTDRVELVDEDSGWDEADWEEIKSILSKIDWSAIKSFGDERAIWHPLQLVISYDRAYLRDSNGRISGMTYLSDFQNIRGENVACASNVSSESVMHGVETIPWLRFAP